MRSARGIEVEKPKASVMVRRGVLQKLKLPALRQSVPKSVFALAQT